MKFVGILFVFFGYMFVYAATAAGGRFATEPWASLYADAYTSFPAQDASTLTQAAGAAATGQPLPSGFTQLSPTPPYRTPVTSSPGRTISPGGGGRFAGAS